MEYRVTNNVVQIATEEPVLQTTEQATVGANATLLKNWMFKVHVSSKLAYDNIFLEINN